MLWVKTLGLILSITCLLFIFIHFYRFKKDFQQMEDGEIITEEMSKKWVRRVYWVMFWGILCSILSVLATILHYL